jgi:RsiW-degrading membrane proteinase PrsW (M82 family)
MIEIILGVFLSLLAGVIPTAIYATVIWWFDRYEKEPLWLLAVTFLWGAIPAIILSLIVELILGIPISVLGEGLFAEVVGSGGVAPVIEEIAKAIALLGLFVFLRREFDNVLDGIIYGALVGFGFAMTENMLYFLSSLFTEGWAAWGVVVFVRAVVFGLNHAFFTSLTGAALGFARLSRVAWEKWLVPPLGVGLAIAFHAVHNIGASLAELSCLIAVFSFLTDWGGILVVFVVILLAAQQEKEWITQELKEEVASGVLSQADYALAVSYRQRFVTRWEALLGQSWQRWRQLGRLFHLATELAFKKHQLRTAGNGEDTRAAIARLRSQIVALRGEQTRG